MRRRYETPENRQSEKAIADAFVSFVGKKAWAHKINEAKRDSTLDYFFVRDGALRCVAEIKDRRNWKPSYGTVILSVMKVAELARFKRDLNILAVFIVRLHNGLYFVEVPQHIDWKVGVGGRKDRGDDADMELCYRIPFNDFVRFS